MALSHLIVASEQISTEILQYSLIMIMQVGLSHELYVVSNAFKKNEMGWACGAYGGGERCAQGAGGEA
jgi:hypothetical protein